MIKYLILCIIMGFGNSQATGFAIYGVGENIQNSNPATIALGNSSFFPGNSKNISTGSPSSLWRSALTRFTIHSGMNYLKNTEFPEQYQQSLTSFSLFFPVGNKKVFGFGLQPVYRTNKLEITDEEYQFIGADESITGAPIATKCTYRIDGGIAELFLGYSQKLSPHISGGIKYSFLFGNQYTESKLWTYDVQLSESEISDGEFIKQLDNLFFYGIDPDSNIVSKSRQFSGSTLNFEGRYTLPKHEWVLRASINSKVTVATQNVQTANNITYTNSLDNSSNAILSDIGFGYLFQFINNSGVTVEVKKKFPLNIPENAALFNIMPPGENSIHFGSYYQILNSRIGFWNNINVRGGAYIKEIDFSRDYFLDYGATLGMGIEYLSNTQAFDLALRVGKKESRVLEGFYEEYISFHIGITTGEKWFMKLRRK